jgi:hypothetical protein
MLEMSNCTEEEREGFFWRVIRDRTDPELITTGSEEPNPHLAPSIRLLLEGLTRGLGLDDNLNIKDIPPWVDVEKCRRGQQFARDNYFVINLAEMLSLYLLFSVPGSLGPLVFTGNSSTPFTSFKRYLSTVNRVRSWYEKDLWEENSAAVDNLKYVRRVHCLVRKQLNECSKQELSEKFDLEKTVNSSSILATLYKTIGEESRSSCDASKLACPFGSNRRSVFINQAEMSVTQFGFMGLIVYYPEKFGLTNISEDDFEGFVHLWKVLGYYLGIEDKYNFCDGNLSEVRQKCSDILEYWLKPSMCFVGKEWEHMSRCMTEGVSYYVTGVSFETCFMFLFWVLDVQAPNFYKALTWRQKLMFYIFRITINFTLKIPGMKSFHNWAVRHAIDTASSRKLRRTQLLETPKSESRVYNIEPQPKILITHL